MSLLIFEGVSGRTNDAALQAKFEEYGEVQDFNFYNPSYAEYALGFGHVVFVREKDAEAALQDMNDKEFDGQVIHVFKGDASPVPTARYSSSYGKRSLRGLLGDSGNDSYSSAALITPLWGWEDMIFEWELPSLLRS